MRNVVLWKASDSVKYQVKVISQVRYNSRRFKRPMEYSLAEVLLCKISNNTKAYHDANKKDGFFDDY